MSRLRWTSYTGITVAILVGIGAISLHIGRPMRYEFTSEFRHWVTIQYDEPTCPPLPTRKGFFVVSIPASGKLCTSTSRPEGWIYYEFYLVSANGVREKIPLHSGSSERGLEVWMLTYQPQEKWELDFVGTKAEADHWGTPPYPWRSGGDAPRPSK